MRSDKPTAIMVFGTILLFSILIPPASAQPWWNTSWNYKKQINITNNNLTQTLEQGYTVNM